MSDVPVGAQKHSANVQRVRLRIANVQRPAWLVTMALGLAACTETKYPYPATWPAHVAVVDEQCPHIAGTYDNEGESSIPAAGYRGGMKLYFSQIIQFRHENDYENPEHVTRVRIDGPSEGILGIHFLDARGKVIQAFSYSAKKGDFACVPDGLQRPYGPSPVFIGVIVAAVHLSTNVNGDLVVKRTSTGTGVTLLIIPTQSRYEDFVTFKKLESP